MREDTQETGNVQEKKQGRATSTSSLYTRYHVPGMKPRAEACLVGWPGTLGEYPGIYSSMTKILNFNLSIVGPVPRVLREYIPSSKHTHYNGGVTSIVHTLAHIHRAVYKRRYTEWRPSQQTHTHPPETHRTYEYKYSTVVPGTWISRITHTRYEMGQPKSGSSFLSRSFVNHCKLGLEYWKHWPWHKQ